MLKNFDGMLSGWKEMIFHNRLIHHRRGWLKDHVTRLEEKFRQDQAKESLKGTIRLGESDSQRILMEC